jgi:hypothetical protein
MGNQSVFQQLEVFPITYGMIKLLLPSEKPNNNTIGYTVIPFGEVLHGINSTSIEDRLSMEDAVRRT